MHVPGTEILSYFTAELIVRYADMVENSASRRKGDPTTSGTAIA
jgi:hypothetical protein